MLLFFTIAIIMPFENKYDNFVNGIAELCLIGA